MLKKLAFTLAEVLITLGIIGVVAAMTIPTLMNSTNQAEFKTGYKKIISTLNQAITTNYALDNNDFSNLASGTSTDTTTIFGMFNNRMNVVKTAAAGLNGVAASNYTLYFNDGMEFSFANSSANCNTTTTWCKGVVDVNGDKNPNRLTNCDGSLTETSEGTTACSSAITSGAGAPSIGDRFSIRFGGQEIVPNGPGARYVLYN